MTAATVLQIDGFVKKRIDHIKEINEKLNISVEETNNLIGDDILAIAKFFEETYIEKGMEFNIGDICVQTIKALRTHNLDKHVSLAYAVLPDKFKDKNKNGYKDLEHELANQKIQRSLQELRAVDISKLNADALRQFYNDSTTLTDRINEMLNMKGLSTNEDYDDDLEKDRFKKAEIGDPLYTPEELIKADPEYETVFEELKKTLGQSIHTWEVIYNWFVNLYVPVDTESCRKLVWAFNNWNEFWKPFVDRKYRRDHYQSLMIAARKVIDTSTKASKESRIACGHHFDKNGDPVFRRMTKEQIDAMYDEELNFMFDMFNTQFKMMRIISEENEKHGGRCKEDRAIDLHDTLEHHA